MTERIRPHMGIRIHKILGFGLDDVKFDVDGYDVIDPRFDKDGYIGIGWDTKEEKFNDKGFDEYLEKASEADPDDFSLMMVIRAREDARNTDDFKSKKGNYPNNHRIGSYITQDTEFGLGNVIVFQPPYFGNSWKRYDDIIDYYDPSHSEDDGSISSGVIVLNRPIYPFESWVDCRTTPPTSLTHNEQRMYVESNQQSEYAETMADVAIKELKFDSVDDMREMIRPIIPSELVALLKYLKVFTKDEYIYQLKPMIYWYWG